LKIGAQAVGALAVGALAMGALAIGTLALGRPRHWSLTNPTLEIDDSWWVDPRHGVHSLLPSGLRLKTIEEKQVNA